MFGNDVLSALEAISNGQTIADKTLSGLLGVGFALHHEHGGQGFQTLFASHLGTGAALGLIGQIDVFEGGHFPAVVNTLLQFGGHLLLLGNGLHNGVFALGNFLQTLLAVADGRNLHLV